MSPLHSSVYPRDHCFQSSTEHPVAVTTHRPRPSFCFCFVLFCFHTRDHNEYRPNESSCCSNELIKLSTVLGFHCPVLDATSPTRTWRGGCGGTLENISLLMHSLPFTSNRLHKRDLFYEHYLSPSVNDGQTAKSLSKWLHLNLVKYLYNVLRTATALASWSDMQFPNCKVLFQVQFTPASAKSG